MTKKIHEIKQVGHGGARSGAGGPSKESKGEKKYVQRIITFTPELDDIILAHFDGTNYSQHVRNILIVGVQALYNIN